jgi:hypothetical protein
MEKLSSFGISKGEFSGSPSVRQGQQLAEVPLSQQYTLSVKKKRTPYLARKKGNKRRKQSKEPPPPLPL